MEEACGPDNKMYCEAGRPCSVQQIWINHYLKSFILSVIKRIGGVCVGGVGWWGGVLAKKHAVNYMFFGSAGELSIKMDGDFLIFLFPAFPPLKIQDIKRQ